MSPSSHTRWTPEERELVERYLAGERTNADAARRLIALHPGPKIAAEIMASEDLAVAPSDVERAWEHMTQRIADVGGPVYRGDTRWIPPALGLERKWTPEVQKSRGGIGKFGARTLQFGLWTGALLVVIVGLALLTRRVPETRLGLTHVYATQTITTANGRQTTVTLADGSHVLLNAGSRLRFPRDMNNRRTVDLDGEAMFTVNQRSTTPFIVQVGTARVTVLGTTFVVRRYPEDHRIRVVVADGRVQLRSGHSPTAPPHNATLSSRMLGEILDSTQTIAVTSDVDLLTYTDWTQGHLIFQDVPLRNVFPELERRYGLRIRIADPAIADLRLRATITDAPVNDVLDIIAMTFGMHYTRHANAVTFFRPSSPTPRIDQQSSYPEARYGK